MAKIKVGENMYDIIIVGAGPAGLTAALYAARANKKVLVLEAKAYGGQIINAHKIENYPGIKEISGVDYANTLYEQVKELGVEIKLETVLRLTEDKKVITTENEYQSLSIIIATGAKNRKLNIADEDKFLGHGVSYCATCDGNFYRDKVVAVVGGGNTALEDALFLADLAQKVYLIHRRDEFRGERKYLNELKIKSNVEFILNSSIVHLNGQEFLEGITIKNNAGEAKDIAVSALFIAVGQEPSSEAFANVVEVNSNGYIEADDGVHTRSAGIYVAGDIRVKNLRQLTTAVSDGSIAAMTAILEINQEK